jgi:hypothetical protein
MKKSKKQSTRILQFILKNYLPNFFLMCFLFLRTFKKFKKSINQSKKTKPFSTNNLDKINNCEYKITSQNNEDGIIEYIFKKIPNNKYFCEIGFGYYEFNSLNLIRNGWSGRLIDIDLLEALALKANLAFFYHNSHVRILNNSVNKENINKLIFPEFEKKKIDFFSIDIDGNDYWVLKECNLDEVSCVCLEYNHWLGVNLKKVMNYKENFNFVDDGIFGASLLAFDTLMNSKGFKLIAVESSGTNAFYVQNKFSHFFEILDPIKSFKSVGRFYSKERKKKIFNNIELSKLFLEV